MVSCHSVISEERLSAKKNFLIRMNLLTGKPEWGEILRRVPGRLGEYLPGLLWR
jgi:hypothetical protein